MYPSIWKLSHVISIHQGDRSLLSNYRLISLISCVGKVFERIIFKNVYNHLIVNNLVYQYQSGFLPKHSIYHLLEIYQYILSRTSNSHACSVTFLKIAIKFGTKDGIVIDLMRSFKSCLRTNSNMQKWYIICYKD